MRIALSSALVFFALIGSAQASSVTAVGAVKALTDTSQVLGLVGTAGFDEGPTTGNVPLNQYSAQGLTWGTGSFQSILSTVTTQGTAYAPVYDKLYTIYFPGPIGGGGSQVAQCNHYGGVATFSGAPITQVGLTASNAGNQYLTVWAKSGLMIGQVAWSPTGNSQFVGIDTLGVPIGMVSYGNDDLWAGQIYDISGSTIISDTWVWATGKCATNAQCDDQNVCTTDTCTVATGVCVHAPNTLSCSDGNSCTQNDTCLAGACVPGAPVTCAALDGCHAAGVCNPMSGVCSNPAKQDGSACNDGNSCTQSDTCQAGVCTGAKPVICAAPDACHFAGTCDATTGMCVNAAKPDGAACSDSNACTQADTCQTGVCTGANPVVCAAQDACHTVGLCDTTTGVCSNPAKQDGTSCDDANACTQGDTCVQGACLSGSPVVCAPANGCQIPGTCDPTTGVCTNTPLPDGTLCDDSNACTQGDSCMAGACVSGVAVTCPAADACHDDGVCDPKSGTCSTPAKAEGAPCNDGENCTVGDSCKSGVCTPTSTTVCVALDKCHDVGECDGQGQCTNPPKNINCKAKTVCEQDGTCDGATGLCINAAKPDGVPCGKGFCIAGTCSDEAGNTTSATGTGGGSSTSTGAGGASATSTGVGGAGAGGASTVTGAGGASTVTGAGGATSGTTSTGVTGTGSGEGVVTPAGGCGCSTPGTEPTRAPWLALGLGLLLPAWRRRRKATRVAA